MEDTIFNHERLDQFDKSLSFPLRKHDFLKNRDELFVEQKEKDKFCMLKIARAENKGIITKEGADYLRKYYHDGMKVYAQMFLVLNQIFGEEESITIIDPATKKIILENANLRHVTPNTCAIFKFSDKNKNPVFLTLPGMKNIDRAIDKIKIGGKYSSPSQLRDILRFSIGGKRYNDICEIDEKLYSLSEITIDDRKTKDKFCANDVSQPQKFNEKNFRNKVIYLELENDLIIEGQEKIISLDLVDNLTHGYYEQLRLLKEDQAIAEKNKVIDMTNLELTIFDLYRWGIEKHNQNEVLEKIVRMEERFDFLQVEKNKEGLYEDCIKFIDENFLVRPKQALLLNEPLPNISKETKERIALETCSPELQALFRDVSDDIENVFKRYKKYIAPKYRCTIMATNNRLQKGR